jgi:hypothetical protein
MLRCATVCCPRFGSDDDARVLWVLRLAHGIGESYRVITMTALRDGAAWERLADRLEHGDLADWARAVGQMGSFALRPYEPSPRRV